MEYCKNISAVCFDVFMMLLEVKSNSFSAVHATSLTCSIYFIFFSVWYCDWLC